MSHRGDFQARFLQFPEYFISYFNLAHNGYFSFRPLDIDYNKYIQNYSKKMYLLHFSFQNVSAEKYTNTSLYFCSDMG